ncbi:glycoprotein [Persimmon virus A]|uniref:Glycoprotein n=1 Tax=Persimmon virus A TaxID=1211480 RepID=R4WAS4_9RHAB|nr:glycoprotein [Persimmon virus A]BAM36034.1 glycoprotein [Persimmon virus A]
MVSFSGFVTIAIAMLLIGLEVSVSDSSSDTFLNSSVGPIAVCGKKSLNIETTLSECFERCRRMPQPTSTAKIGLHQVTAKGLGPRVVECKKVTITQQFVETWTFSTWKSTPTREYSLPSEEECKTVISKKCGTLECDIREPTSLTEDYLYASTNFKKETYISLITMPSSFFTSGVELMIMPLASEDQFSVTRESGESTTARYYWKKVDPLTECPFERVGQQYRCDYFEIDKNDKHWLCNRGGFSLTPKSEIETVIPVCKGLVQSKEGMIYEILDKSDKLSIWSQRLSSVGTTYKDADTDWLKEKINHMMSSMDSDLCILQCQILSLEARMYQSSSRVLKIAANIILLRPDGTGEKCETAHGCKLSTPHLMCGDPPRVAITCTGTSAYWDPKEPYALMDGHCSKPGKNEKLTFSARHHTYVIDDDLKSLLPSGFMHRKTHDLFSIDHLKGLQFKQEDIDEIRTSWNAHKTSESSAELTDSSVDKDHCGIMIDIITGSKKLLSGVVDYFSYIKYLVYVIVGLIVAGMSIKLMMLFVPSKRVKEPGMRYASVRQATEPTIEWI